MLYKGLILVFIMEYMRPDTFIPLIGALKINTLLPLILFAMSFISKDQEKLSNKQIPQINEARWLLFFLSLIVLSILTADVTFYAFNIFKAVLGYIFLFWIIAREVNTLNRLKGIMAVLVFIHIALVMLNPNIITDPATRSYIRGVTFLGDGNDFALSVLIAFSFALFLFQDAKSRMIRYICLFGLTTLLLVVIGTQSRGATLALACILFYQWLRSRRKAFGLALILMLVALILVYAPTQYFERIETITEYQSDGSAMGRITAWKTAVRMAASYPLTGVGAGNFPMKHATEFVPPEFSGLNFPWKTAHSIYFLALGELGIPGILFLLFIIFRTLWLWDKKILNFSDSSDETGKRIRKLLLSLNSGLIAYGAAGAFLSALYYPHIFVLMGMFVAAIHIINRDYKKVSQGIKPNGDRQSNIYGLEHPA